MNYTYRFRRKNIRNWRGGVGVCT